MKVRDFAAELISEIADELDYLVYKYECSSPSCGHIVFEKETGDEDDDEDAATRKYKILDYSKHTVTLTRLLGEQHVIDLHEPESVDELREWFEDLDDAFDSPLGMSFQGYSHWPMGAGTHTHTIAPNIGHQVTSPPYTQPLIVTPHTQPYTSSPPYTISTTTAPYIPPQPSSFSGVSGGVSGTINSSMWIGGDTLTAGVSQSQLTVSNQSDDLFSFSSFGSIPLGP